MKHRLNAYLDAQDRQYAAAMRRDAEDIDRDVCAQSECDNCGNRGLIFVNIGLGRCPQCKTRVEF